MDLLSIGWLSLGSFIPQWMWWPAHHSPHLIPLLWATLPQAYSLSWSPISPLGVSFLVFNPTFSLILLYDSLFSRVCLSWHIWMVTGRDKMDVYANLIPWFSEKRMLVVFGMLHPISLVVRPINKAFGSAECSIHWRIGLCEFSSYHRLTGWWPLLPLILTNHPWSIVWTELQSSV